MGLLLRPKECTEHDKQSFPFDERLYKGEREFFSLTTQLRSVPKLFFFSNKSWCNAKTFKMPSNMHNQSWRCFSIVRIWVKDPFNTMLVLIIIFLVWMKTKLAQEKVTQTIHPFVSIKTKRERKETIKEKKQTSHPKAKVEEQGPWLKLRWRGL